MGSLLSPVQHAIISFFNSSLLHIWLEYWISPSLGAGHLQLHGQSACAKIGLVEAGHLAQGSSTPFSLVAKSSQDSHPQTLQRSASLLLGTSTAPVETLQQSFRIFKLGQEVKLPTRQGLSAFEIYRPVSHTSIVAV